MIFKSGSESSVVVYAPIHVISLLMQKLREHEQEEVIGL